MTVKQLAKNDPQSLIGRAYRFAEKAHAGQRRKNGEPYFNHVLAAAEVLNQWRLDEATVAAGLLHDTVEDTGVALEALRKEFGDEVAFLVDGVTKIGRIKYRGATAKVENLRKMILALSEDLRVVFVKLADRLHNMQTLGALPPAKQKRIAMETDDIYAPLAYRLGMQHLSGELHDLAFPYLHPSEHRWLRKTAVEHYESRMKYLEALKPEVEKVLEGYGFAGARIDFRPKRYSSLYQKLMRYDMDIEKIYDLVAMRIIVDSVADCYAILGYIHEHWPPLPGRIKDYIAMPKPNTYRSLHTTVIGPDKKIVEFQIRTNEMHEANEHGIAAHWLYEQHRRDGKELSPRKLTEEIKWVQQLRNWQEKYQSGGSGSEEFLGAMKVDFFRDRIFAITPRGDVIDLPAGATPVDFAYQVHTEVGNSCVGAKVNGKIVPLDYELRSGNLVEIITQKGKKPAKDWLEFVKTASARDRIRTALRGGMFLRKTRGPSKAEFRIVVEDRIGLIKDISSIFARSHANIVSFESKDPAGSRFPIDKVVCDTTDKNKLEKLVLKLKKLPGVKEVSYRLM